MAVIEAPIDELIVDPKLYSDEAKYHAVFRRLRAEAPVRWIAPNGIRPFWLVSKHADIIEIERHYDRFLNAPRAVLRTIADEERIAAERGGNANLLRSMNNMDGMEHRAYRGVTQAEFQKSAVEKLTAQVDEIAAEFVDRLIAKGPQCDFVESVAAWYPLRVIMSLFGIPASEEAHMLELTLLLFGGADAEIRGRYRHATQLDTVREFFDCFRPALDERRATPRGDIASKIANATIRGAPITELEALSYCVTIATAGHDTTAATIAGGLLALMQNPDQMAALRADPDALPGAIDEMVRWVAPVKNFFRTATEDYELRGQAIKAGDALMLAFPSGSRDEEVFEDPFRFRIDRQNNRHLSFGSGAHICLGQHLARLEIQCFFRHFLDRIAAVELAGQPQWVDAWFISGLKHLPIAFSTRQ